MEKDIDKIPKNPDTDIVIRIDDFGGKIGLTIREFVKSERYTGFTKAGTRIPADQFKKFKAAINSIKEEDFEGSASDEKSASGEEEDKKEGDEDDEDSDEESDVERGDVAVANPAAIEDEEI